MGSRPFKKKSQRVMDFAARKSDRYSKIGRATELKVAELLRRKAEEALLHSFEYNRPNGNNDLCGKDFTVRKLVGNNISVRHFGITISKRRHHDHKMKHPDIPSILITFEMRDERIWERIEELFKQ